MFKSLFLIPLFLVGCASTKPMVITKPVVKPCITEDIRLTPLPIDGVKKEQFDAWVASGQFEKIQNILFASFVILNEDVKVLRDMLNACK